MKSARSSDVQRRNISLAYEYPRPRDACNHLGLRKAALVPQPPQRFADPWHVDDLAIHHVAMGQTDLSVATKHPTPLAGVYLSGADRRAANVQADTYRVHYSSPAARAVNIVMSIGS